MHAPRFLVPALAVVCVASFASADTITSTQAGGAWFTPSTWVGGVVPSATDDVVVAGPVTIAGIAPCQSVDVTGSGSVNGAIVAPPRILQVTGSVTNHGGIGNANPYYLNVEVGGDIDNAGTWTTALTSLTGTADRTISQAPGYGFDTHLEYAAGAAGDLVATTPLTFSGDLDLVGGRLVLQPDCPLTLPATAFSGDMAAGGNEVIFESWSYLNQCTIDDVVLVGQAYAGFNVNVTTRLVVMDGLKNGGTGGGGSVTIDGDLVNHGVITNQNYSFSLRITGDVENSGTISNPQLEFLGTGVEHHLSMSPDAVLTAQVFLPEFQPSTLVADTPLRLGGGCGLGLGTLILPPGNSLELTNYGGLGSGTVLAGGNEIIASGQGAIAGATIDQAVLEGQVIVAGINTFTGGLVINGTVSNGSWVQTNLTVDGTLTNLGTVEDGVTPVTFTALGDVDNQGTFTSTRLNISGTGDQQVGAGAQGIAVDQFVIASNLQAASFQWYRDGVALPGETQANLTLAMVGADDYGTYTCIGDGVTSRAVTIAETINVTDVPGAAAAVALDQNAPNPFNPATSIAFRLDTDAHVSLVVYDLSGRQVASLVDRALVAGRHEIAWQPRDLPSGTYVYRLRAGATDLSRKCTLLK